MALARRRCVGGPENDDCSDSRLPAVTAGDSPFGDNVVREGETMCPHHEDRRLCHAGRGAGVTRRSACGDWGDRRQPATIPAVKRNLDLPRTHRPAAGVLRHRAVARHLACGHSGQAGSRTEDRHRQTGPHPVQPRLRCRMPRSEEHLRARGERIVLGEQLLFISDTRDAGHHARKSARGRSGPEEGLRQGATSADG